MEMRMKKIVLFQFLLLNFCLAHTIADNDLKIGAKIHFEEESGRDYTGLKEINAFVRSILKSTLRVTQELGDHNTKILLKRKADGVQIDHYTEKKLPDARRRDACHTYLHNTKGIC